MKIKSIIILSITLIVIFLSLIICYYLTKPTIWSGDKLIGHAFGEVDGKTYTNSKEAFEAAYERGVRTFEVDFQLSSDGKVVLAHDWGAFRKDYGDNIVPTEEQFLKTSMHGKYTRLSFGDLLDIMNEYPNIWIVTDSKYTEKELIENQFNEMVMVAKEKKLENLLERFIVQIYNEDMYATVSNIYPFKNIIFTLYQRWNGKMDELRKICDWSVSNNIKNITMDRRLFSQEVLDIIKEYNLNIYLHTENDLEKTKSYLEQGVSGIYTDNISVEQLD